MIGYCSFVKEAGDHRWILPGGWADVTESPAAAVAREVREEAGIEVRPYKLGRPVGSISASPWSWATSHVWRLFFLWEIIGGELRLDQRRAGWRLQRARIDDRAINTPRSCCRN